MVHCTGWPPQCHCSKWLAWIISEDVHNFIQILIPTCPPQSYRFTTDESISQLKEHQKRDFLLQSPARPRLNVARPCQPCPWLETRTRPLQFSQTRTAQETQCPLSMRQLFPVKNVMIYDDTIARREKQINKLKRDEGSLCRVIKSKNPFWGSKYVCIKVDWSYRRILYPGDWDNPTIQCFSESHGPFCI